jgi:hypothetical protein
MKYVFPLVERDEKFQIDVVADTLEHAYQETFRIMECSDKTILLINENREIVPFGND